MSEARVSKEAMGWLYRELGNELRNKVCGFCNSVEILNEILAALRAPAEGADERMLLVRIIRASRRESMSPSMVALLDKAYQYLCRTHSGILREVPAPHLDTPPGEEEGK